jgi:glycosyltransferase involved in cell wall biosynthesis
MQGQIMGSKMILLLGRRDEPTDGVEDYCGWLGRALEQHDCSLELVRMPWNQTGWRAELGTLEARAANWRGKWVLAQYTALGWSRRGFPLRFLQVLRVLRRNGVQLAVIFHDVQPYGGARLIDRIRRACQIWVMRRAYRWADRAVLTVSLERVRWLPAHPAKAAFVPVGANLLPLPINGLHDVVRNRKTVAVYGVTGGAAALSEVHDIGYAVKHAASQLGELRLVVLGRGSLEAEKALRHEFEGAGIDLSVEGVLPPEQVVQALALADVLLFVRGGISSRRGSALAGVACELPVVGYRSEETAFPVTEAGVVLVPLQDRQALGEALTQVLANDDWRKQLRARSRAVQEQYLSWDAISRSFLQLLNQGAAQ